MAPITNPFIRRRELAPLPQAADQDQPTPTGRQASFGSPNEVHIGEHSRSNALTVSAWYRGVDLRARTMAMLSVEYQKLSESTGGNYVLDTRGPLAARYLHLFQVQPNPLMNWVDLMEQAEIRRIMDGNAVIYIERDTTGEVTALWLCATASYNISTNTYNITWYGIGGVQTLCNLPSTSVIHIRNTFRTDDGIFGISILRYAARSLSLSATNDQQSLDSSAKGGKMKLLVQESGQGTFGIGRASKDQMKKATRQLASDLYESDVVMLTNIASVTPISQTAQAMELLQSRAFSVSDVARFIGVPKFLIMDDSGGSYKSPEAATQEFLQRTIAPSIREWECELNAKLLGRAGYPIHRFHLCELPLLRLDPKGQADIDRIQLETGVRSVNELRQRYDLPAIPDGDIHYISTNLAPVGSPKLNGTPTPSPVPVPAGSPAANDTTRTAPVPAASPAGNIPTAKEGVNQ